MGALILLERSIFGTPKLKRISLDAPLMGLILYILVVGVIHIRQLFTFEAIVLFFAYIALFYVVVYSVRTRQHSGFWSIGLSVLPSCLLSSVY